MRSAIKTLIVIAAINLLNCKKDVQIPNGIWNRKGTVIEAEKQQEQLSVQEPNIMYDTCPQLIKSEKWIFKMWYRSGWSNPYVSYAESSDGLSWTQCADLLVPGHYCPSIIKHKGVYYLWAVTGNWHELDLFSSTDGIHFKFRSKSLKANSSRPLIGNTSVYVDSSNKWKMLYEASCSESNVKWEINLATSDDGISWNEYERNPVIRNSNGSCGGSEIHKIGDTYYLWMHCSPSGILPTDIYRCESRDLITWTTTASGPTFPRHSSDEGFNLAEGQVADPTLVEVNGSTYMFYDACTDGSSHSGKAHIKLAVANMPMHKLVNTNEGAK